MTDRKGIGGCIRREYQNGGGRMQALNDPVGIRKNRVRAITNFDQCWAFRGIQCRTCYTPRTYIGKAERLVGTRASLSPTLSRWIWQRVEERSSKCLQRLTWDVFKYPMNTCNRGLEHWWGPEPCEMMHVTSWRPQGIWWAVVQFAQGYMFVHVVKTKVYPRYLLYRTM